MVTFHLILNPYAAVTTTTPFDGGTMLNGHGTCKLLKNIYMTTYFKFHGTNSFLSSSSKNISGKVINSSAKSVMKSDTNEFDNS